MTVEAEMKGKTFNVEWYSTPMCDTDFEKVPDHTKEVQKTLPLLCFPPGRVIAAPKWSLDMSGMG